MPVEGRSLPFVTHPDQLNQARFAEWIGPGSEQETGVFYFRRTFESDNLPPQFVVHISGDNRYRFYVNGHLACWGPAVHDLYHWNYETVDLAPFLCRVKIYSQLRFGTREIWPG
ncbi:MAG: hypothetical protein EHM46_03650 [Bacteroidetes bacterium]|nr:MAG: hypothetical protein EHM46_03650 [Bacteroidota bacterium]